MLRRTFIQRHGPLIAVLIVSAFLALIRIRIADVPIERDEGEYAYAAQLILQGIPPYKLAYNMKFPGTYYAYSLILGLFGQTPMGIHIGLLIVNAATILVIFFLARRILKDGIAAAVAASAFGFLTIDRWIMGLFAHATHFVVLAGTAGLLVLLRAIDSRKTSTFIFSGVMLGLSVLMKQNGIFFLGAALAFTAWIEMKGETWSPHTMLFRSILILFGAAIPFGLLVAVLLKNGVFGNFVFWTFQYATEYASEIHLSEAPFIFLGNLADVTRTTSAIWILGLIGVPLLKLAYWPERTRQILTWWFAISLISICPGLYFRPHYFILLAPALSLFVAATVLSLEFLLTKHVGNALARVAAVGVFVATVTAYAVQEREYLFRMPAQELSRSRYSDYPFVEAVDVADYIRANSSPSDTIGILGSEPEIPFYAKRKSATGYLYVYGLMEEQKYAQSMREQMIQELTSAHPKYVVFVDLRTSWRVPFTTHVPFRSAARYLEECYEQVRVIDTKYQRAEISLTDLTLSEWQIRRTGSIQIYRQKTGAPCGIGKY